MLIISVRGPEGRVRQREGERGKEGERREIGERQREKEREVESEEREMEREGLRLSFERPHPLDPPLSAMRYS